MAWTLSNFSITKAAELATLLYSIFYVALVVQISNLCTTIYLHRSLAHRSIKLKPLASGFMQIWLWLHSGIHPREWVAVHRKHHAFPDQEGDPHSPHLEGLYKVLLANVYFYRREANNPATISRYTRDMPETWMEKYITRRGTLGLVVGAALAALLLGPLAGVAAFVVQAVVYIFLNSVINSVCHYIGYRNFDNTATNLKMVAWLTAGEGLHNNHHHRPSAVKLSMRRLEFDPAWPVIWMLKTLRLAEI